MGISVVINTYNAAAHLAEVLERVREFDEVVVCDMESTDETCSIAKQAGCRVVTFPKGEYRCAEPARNFAIQSASHPWVLVIDADELVTDELRTWLYDFVKSPGAYAGVWIPRKNYSFNRFLKSSYPDYQLRLMKKEGCYWPPTVHTVAEVAGEVYRIPAHEEQLALIHLSAKLTDSFRKVNEFTDNEVVKRHGEKVTLLKMMLAPAHRFIKTYFFKGGIFYGKVGFIQAQRNAIYKFLTLAKLYEDENRRKMGR